MKRFALMALAAGMMVAAAPPKDSETPKERIVGRWEMIGADPKDRVEFFAVGKIVYVAKTIRVDGKVTPLIVDGKAVEATMNGHYKFTDASTIEGEIDDIFAKPDQPAPAKRKFKLTSVSVTKDRLSYRDEDGNDHEFKRAQ